MTRYIGVQDAAVELGISPARVSQLCSTGKIKNCMKVSNVWLIESPIQRIFGKPGRPVKRIRTEVVR